MSSRVLIVEDCPLLSRILSRVFSLRGWTADVSSSAPAALGLFKAGRYDLVLCDIELPGGDGVSLAQALLKAQPSLFVIMTSGSPKNIARARQAGFSECLPKPYSLEELRARIDQHGHFADEGRRAEIAANGGPDDPFPRLVLPDPRSRPHVDIQGRDRRRRDHADRQGRIQ